MKKTNPNKESVTRIQQGIKCCIAWPEMAEAVLCVSTKIELVFRGPLLRLGVHRGGELGGGGRSRFRAVMPLRFFITVTP